MRSTLPSDLLLSADTNTLRAFAKFHDDLARKLRAHAAELERRAAQHGQTEEWFSLLRSLPFLVDAKLAEGMDYDRAVHWVSVDAGVACETVELYMQKRDKQRQDDRRAARNLEIMRMTKRGLTYADIAAAISANPEFGKISKGQVSRIARQTIKATHKAEPKTRE